ncbi:MAG: HNH endonuclease [Acidimicrobiales bacterium]
MAVGVDPGGWLIRHRWEMDRGESATLAGFDRATAQQLACDTSTVTHLIGAHGQPLAQGRKTRLWSTAQRRAALIRDGGHCRFPSCDRRIADLHHQQPWTHGGPTDLDNGFLACPRHHTLLHHGYHAHGNPNTQLTFTRPDGTTLGTTTPARRP